MFSSITRRLNIIEYTGMLLVKAKYAMNFQKIGYSFLLASVHKSVPKTRINLLSTSNIELFFG